MSTPEPATSNDAAETPPTLTTPFASPPVVVFMLAGIAFISFDWVAIERSPLRHLGVAYPWWLDAAPLLIAVGGLVAWLATCRRWPVAAPLVVLFGSILLATQIPGCFQRRAARIPIVAMPSSAMLDVLTQRIGAPVTARTSSGDRPRLWVAPQHEAAARAALAAEGLLDASAR